jgi:hypothetical protein
MYENMFPEIEVYDKEYGETGDNIKMDSWRDLDFLSFQ